MTAAGWHPDPHGRADRRYHDGIRWTEHVADAAGDTSVDAPDPDPDAPWPASPVIGPPPPRATAAPSPPEPSPASEPPPELSTSPEPSPSPEPSAFEPSASPGVPSASSEPSDPPEASDQLAVGADHTQQLGPAELGKVARPVAADHTVVMTPDDVAQAAALAAAPPPNPDATRHTMPIDPADVEAARRSAAAGIASGEDTTELVVRTGRRRSVVGIVLAVLGTALGLVGLFVLPWVGGPGPDGSYLDLRELVDRIGPDLGGAATAFVLTGALLAVAGGGVAALARAVGVRGLRVLAAALVVLGVAGLAVLGFMAADVDGAAVGVPDVADVGPQGGTPVTLPDGSPVTDPTSGAPVTVPEGGLDPEDVSDESLVGAATALAEDRLADAAVVGAVGLVVAGVLLVAGLLAPGVPGHVVTALGLLVLAGWAAVATSMLGDEGALADVGTGPWAVVAGSLVLAAGAAVPGPRRDPARRDPARRRDAPGRRDP